MSKQQHHQRHIAQRTCVVCREKMDKRSLYRIVHNEDGTQIDASGKMRGRGAYLCNKPSCWEHAMNTNILSQALRTTLLATDRERLQQAMPQS